VFETLSDRLTQVFSSLRGRGRLSAADIDATCREIRIALLEADVALPVARGFIARVKERASSAEVSQALNPTQQVIKIVHDELVTILGGEARRLRFAKTPPTVIMLAGLQGSGKTTLAAKLARWLREQGNTPLLVAADLQRPNAVQQLEVLGERASVPVFAPEPGNGVGDPVAVARQSVDEAQRRQHNIVVIDTAGRLGIDEEMMRQAAAIRDATDPDEILFVVDAMIGQDAVVTAQAFLDGVGYDGVVLTKLDGDARGGAALSIAQLTGRPVMFASTGEKLEDFDIFHPDRMASRILDLGDMLTLIEQAERAFDADQAASMAGKLATGEGFTLEDFVEQLSMVRSLGPIGNLLGMLPGAAQHRDALSQISDKDLDRAAAIVNSMTPQERRNPKVLNGSRRARIARGAGVTVGEVNNLVVRFLEGQKMMRQMLGGGGLPGMPPIPGMRRAASKAAKGRKASGKKKPKGGRPGGAPGRAASGAAGTAGARGAGGQKGGAPGAGGLRGAAGGIPGLTPGDLRGAAGLAGLKPGDFGGVVGGGLPGLTSGDLRDAGGPAVPAGLRGARGGLSLPDSPPAEAEGRGGGGGRGVAEGRGGAGGNGEARGHGSGSDRPSDGPARPSDAERGDLPPGLAAPSGGRGRLLGRKGKKK
jgi:signal recognition particle subunit SRP54